LTNTFNGAGPTPTNDPFTSWLDAVTERHMQSLTFQELRRAIQALSSLYVERRGRLGRGTALDGVGKRAAFACFFAPLHFLLIREIVRALGAGTMVRRTIFDLGCGTGAAGAAWASEMSSAPAIVGLDRSPWALQEAKWTYTAFGLRGAARTFRMDQVRFTPRDGVIAAFALNEMDESLRERLGSEFLNAAERGAAILVIEPVAKAPVPWWNDWAWAWKSAGGVEAEWRFHVPLPERLKLLDKAAGLNHRDLTARSLWLTGTPT
jgi:hypothetical protein